MYEDSWYSFVPEAHSKQDDGQLQKSQHRRRESLLKQPNDAENAAAGPSVALSNLLEDLGAVKGPPTATVARRSKSYNDFYSVARAQIMKDPVNLKPYDDQEPITSEGSVKNELAFAKMYEAHEDELLEGSQEEFRIYGDQLALSIRHLDGLLRDASAALDLLASLSDSFKTVEDQTTAFQAQCEDVFTEQKRLKLLSSEVTDGLQYYAYLEPITRRLNAPSASSVIGDEGFVEMMTNLDDCIEFMIKHPDHRDSETYFGRYESLLDRVLALIANMFLKSIQASAAAAKAAEVERRGSGGGTVTMTDVYIFQAPQSGAEIAHICQSLRYISAKANRAIELEVALIQPVWGGVRSQLQTYERQLNEMVDVYIGVRRRAIPDYVYLLLSKTIAVAISPHAEFDRYARECINVALEICGNEHTKYLRLFWGHTNYPTGATGAGEPRLLQLTIERGQFRAFLHEIADIVYKILVAQLQQIDMLSVVNLAIWLNERSYYQTSSDEWQSSHYDDREDEVAQEHSAKAKAQVAGDINRMIVKLALKFVRESLHFNVKKYTAKPTDLTYSQARLENLSSPMSKLNFSDQPSQPKAYHEKFMEDQVAARVEKALGPGILDAYAPVKTACGLLLYVHDLSFEHNGENLSSIVAYEVIHETCAAVMRTAEQVAAKFSKIDGQIFSIKNLVLLKNLVIAYEIAGSRRASALDFKNIWITFAELRNRGELFDISSYYKLLASGDLFPRVVESIQDARVELDGLIRQNITLFCEESASLVSKGNFAGRKGMGTAEDEIKKKLLHSHPNEEQLRNTLWEAVIALVRENEKKKRRFEE